jgi:antitoxin HigA-1
MPRVRTHPGEVLAEEYLKPLGLSASALAQAIGVPANRITDVIRQRRDVSADTAIRLGRFFAVDPRFWLNLQTAYDLSLAESEHDYSSVRPRPARIAQRRNRYGNAKA